jgi:formamidopyrimidine-DNA glycosylase
LPELIEVESARQLIEAQALDREVESVYAPDPWFLKRGLTPELVSAVLPGLSLAKARRRGKLLLVDTTSPDTPGPVLALHLGMSGRVLVDDEAAGDPLLYASNAENPAWHRFGLRFADGGSLYLRDPRRLGAVELDPDEERLGRDALDLRLPELRRIVSRSRAPLKAVLMDQGRIAGLGNLLVDEILWRAGLDPDRPADSLDADEQAALQRAIRTTLRVLMRRGGSHTGDLMAQRVPGGYCPRDGTPLERRRIGGRTTYSCPLHQV